MQEIPKVPTTFAVVKKGESGLLTLLERIKTRGNSQVLILGRGVGAFYNDKELIPSVLGKDWTTFVPPYAPTWEQNQMGIKQFSTLIQEDANPPRVGIFNAYPDFIRDQLFLPSKSGPYSASIYYLGLSETPLADMETFKRILSRDYIQSPWLECIFSADDNKLLIREQDELNEAILAQTNLDEILPRILRSLQGEVAALEARKFADAVKKVTKKWWQFWMNLLKRLFGGQESAKTTRNVTDQSPALWHDDDHLGRLMDEKLKTQEGRRQFAQTVSKGSGDYALASGATIFTIWFRTPWSEMGGSEEVAMQLVLLRDQGKLPSWLMKQEASANVLLGNYEVETFPECPGCLVSLMMDTIAEGIRNRPNLKVEEKSERHCPSCDNILPADAIRCNKCGHRFM